MNNGYLTAKLHELSDTIFSELKAFYPDVFHSSLLNYTYAVYTYLESWLDEIAEVNNEKDLALKRLAHYTQADKFSGSKSMEVAYEKNFDEICIVLNQNTSSDIREKTVREFYALYDFLEKQSREAHIQKSGSAGRTKV